MGVNFSKVCKHFSARYINVLRCDKNLTLFKDVKLITKDQSTFSKDIIYIGNMSFVESKINDAIGATFILINDSKFPLEKLPKNDLNVIELKDSEDIYEIFNYTRDLFLEDIEIVRETSTLLNAAIMDNGLDYIIKVASEILCNPIIIVDINYKILANSTLDDITDKYWRKNIKKGYCSYDFISEIKKMKDMQIGIKSNEPFEVVCKGSPVIKLVSAIKIGSTHVGNIILLSCKRKLLPKDNELLVLTSKIVAGEMKKDNFYKNTKNIAYERIIYDILDGKLSNKEVFNERIKNSNTKFPKKISVFVFDISNYSSYRRQSNYLTDTFNLLFPLKDLVYYKDNIILINDNEKVDEPLQEQEKLKEFLTENKIYLGISKEFSNMIECQKYYFQSIKAIKIGKIRNPKDFIINYRDIQFYDLLSLKSDELNYEEYYHPALFKLKEYDKINKTDFYNTLFVYLKNNQSIQNTSDELLIHRNTTRYRIQKIVDVTHLDVLDNEDMFNIYVSYKIADYLEKFKRYSKV
ncbi:helix-turn-helix domain-containing protein [Clostridium algidicarnis]|uniref:PucR family transcriptional regulator n=1 Tax=Clostridium algidicarnis TaxID=37659 RepID=UPI001C0D0C35|nr:PucR family transcriptional regulator [Clostridium algidicarnis]MBU3206700.1 helix-turn-helix domain-containing protein [Clostridium algidicarnis]